MMVNIGPSQRHKEETLMSLKFAERAKKVETKPVVNQKVDYKVLVMQLQEEVDANEDNKTKIQMQLDQALEELDKEREVMRKLKEKNHKLEEDLMDGITASAAEEFNKELNTKEEEIGSMEEKLEKYKKSLHILKEEYDELTEKYGKVKTEVKELKKDKEAFQEERDGFEKEMTMVRAEMKEA